MPTPSQKLADSLAVLHEKQQAGRRVFRSSEFTRVSRERLLKNGFLQEVIKGWLISSSPTAQPGDSTPWYASFWEFCGLYCSDRFGDEWHLSPEQSLLLHGANTVIPAQVVVYSPKGTNNNLPLLFETSIYDLKQPQMPAAPDITTVDGLRVFTGAAALIRVPDAFFARNPIETQVVLSGLTDTTDLLRRLLEGGRSVVAGRLAGAFRRIGRAEVAEEIVKAMKSAGYDVRDTDPFTPEQSFQLLTQSKAPLVTRIRALWSRMRGIVIETFPTAPGLPGDRSAYLGFVDEIYKSDAYHSLSIEGYRVTPELIERVRSGKWNPNELPDRNTREALAARGYWQAFQLVRRAVEQVITGKNPGTILRTAHHDWYRELFQPAVAAGLIPASGLAGYRNEPVYLRTSRFVPPRWEAVRDAMPALMDLLESESEPGVRAVLGHWLVGYIHPYPDGNGRMARFVMNLMLASGGYPWTVIRVQDRDKYLNALDRASIDSEIAPFSRFVAERVRWSAEHGAPPTPGQRTEKTVAAKQPT
jgi:fido (protein-threonine AMPylation protein)